MTSIRVLSVASEIYPMIKTGGLADVVGALPAALKAYGIETRTLVPGYPDVINALSAAEELVHLQDFYGGPTRVLGSSYNELDLLVLDAPHLFARPGNPYVTPDGAVGRTMACALPHFREWRPTSVKELSPRSCRMSCTLTIGRPDSRLHFCTMAIVPDLRP